MTNALTDVVWIDTTEGRLTVREALLRAHNPGFFLNQSRPGFEFSSQFRFLMSMLALSIRYATDESQSPVRAASRLVETGLESIHVDKAISTVQFATNVFDYELPFMQRPVIPPKSIKDSALRLGPNDQKVKKLSPAMPSDEGEDFWNLSVAHEDSLELSEALLKLVTHHYFSMAGNNKYAGDKARMGAPGIRFLGKSNSSTEFIWSFEEGSLLKSLLASTPRSWCEGSGLPAWADRTGTRSRQPNGDLHPLWLATWSSNTAACNWEDNRLTGVRIGGVPEEWLPFPTPTKTAEAALKNWWDDRNAKDPLYLYVRDATSALKAKRIDFGKDATELAVEWAAEDNVSALLEKSAPNLLPPGPAEATPIFIRHHIEGTASSPSIRASSLFVPDENLWCFGLDDRTMVRVTTDAQLIQRISRTIARPFPKDDRDNPSTNDKRMILRGLVGRRDDILTEYWRAITHTYENYLDGMRGGNGNRQELYEGIFDAALDAYDTITRPHLAQFANDIFYVRGMVSRFIRSDIHKMGPPPNAEK